MGGGSEKQKGNKMMEISLEKHELNMNFNSQPQRNEIGCELKLKYLDFICLYLNLQEKKRYLLFVLKIKLKYQM